MFLDSVTCCIYNYVIDNRDLYRYMTNYYADVIVSMLYVMCIYIPCTVLGSLKVVTIVKFTAI